MYQASPRGGVGPGKETSSPQIFNDVKLSLLCSTVVTLLFSFNEVFEETENFHCEKQKLHLNPYRKKVGCNNLVTTLAQPYMHVTTLL